MIKQAIEAPELIQSSHNKIIWLGKAPAVERIQKSKKGSKWEMMQLRFHTSKTQLEINLAPDKGEWLLQLLPQLHVDQPRLLGLQDIKDAYEKAGLEDFELFWDNKPVNTLYRAGLLRV